jgi:hypothetical protein
MFENILSAISNQYSEIVSNIEILWPKILWAILILFLWFFVSIWLYRFIIFLFRKFKLKELIDKLDIEIIDEVDGKKKEDARNNDIKIKKIKFSDKIKIDKIVAKAFSYYIFLVFFRLSISVIWINDIEDFLKSLIEYLPNLFIWITILFFWVRFANFIYDLIFHTLELTKEKTSKIIAMWAKIIILFFTIILVLNYIKIVDDFIIHSIFVWFISTLTLAIWLSFGLWWKKVAAEILESFRK